MTDQSVRKEAILSRPAGKSREQILSAAERAFEANGFAQTTMDMVARGAGVAKGSIYNYFESKADLFGQVLANVLDNMEAEGLAIANSSRSASEKIAALIDSIFGMLDQAQSIGRVLLEAWALSSRAGSDDVAIKPQRELYTRWRKLIADIIAQGVREGEFPEHLEPQVGSAVYMAMTDGIIIHVILNVGLSITPELISGLKRGFIAALRNILPEQNEIKTNP